MKVLSKSVRNSAVMLNKQRISFLRYEEPVHQIFKLLLFIQSHLSIFDFSQARARSLLSHWRAVHITIILSCFGLLELALDYCLDEFLLLSRLLILYSDAI